MAISNLLTGRVRVVSPKNVTSDRYQFLDLSQAEPNLGVPSFSASLLTNPAIVVSDDQGNRGFVRSLDLDNIKAKFTGSFSGSGAQLFDVPLSALSDEAQNAIDAALSIQAGKLVSGSVTASVDPAGYFRVGDRFSLGLDFISSTKSATSLASFKE